MIDLVLPDFAAFGDWKWANNPTGTVIDDAQNVIGEIDLFLDGLKVADGAQTTLGFGFDFVLMDDISIDFQYKLRDNLYSNYQPADRNDPDLKDIQPLKLPSYGLADLGLSWNFKFINQKASLRVNINNLFNKEYVSYAFDNVESTDAKINNNRDSEEYLDRLYSTSGWFGFGRTWNASFKVFF